MTAYSYIALNESGIEIRGIINGNDRLEVMQTLRSGGNSPLEVEEGSGLIDDLENKKSLLSYINPFNLKKYGRVKDLDRIVFFRQLTLMIKSGYTILESLETTIKIADKIRLKNALQDIIHNIQGGMKLSEAMLQNPHIFSSLTANLIASGEASGELDEVLERISIGIERSMEVKRDLLTSMIYPSIVLVLSIFVLYFAVTWVIPKFAIFLGKRHLELPALTQFMIDFSIWMQHYGPWMFGLIGLAIFASLVAYTFEGGKRIIDHFLLNLPLLGKFQVSANMANMGWIIEMLLKSGITVMESMHVISKATPHATYSRIYEESAQKVLQGDTLSTGLNQKEIPVMARHLIEVGEKTGELDNVMGEIGAYYSRELSMYIKRMVAWIEPIMLLIVGGIVALIYFSIFSAIWKAATLGR
jgi:type II secretory pathway component PulF